MPNAKQINVSPRLSEVINKFLASKYVKSKLEMLKKDEKVLPMLLEVIGDKPVSELKQADFNNFFDLVQALLPQWKKYFQT